MVASSHTFDHELKIGSTTKGLRLAEDENGRKMYQIVEDIPRYQNPLEFNQSDWSGGHGQHSFDIFDMYYEGQGIDTTQDGRVLLGPLINTVAQWRRSLYNMADYGGSGTITNVRVQARCRRASTPGTAQTSMKIVIKTGGVVYEGTAQTLTNSFTNYTADWATNPGTGSAWTGSQLNSLQIGVSIRNADSTALTYITSQCSQLYAIVTDSGTTNMVPTASGDEAGVSNGTYADIDDTPGAPDDDNFIYDSSASDATPAAFIWFPAISKWIMTDSASIFIYDDSVFNAVKILARVNQFCVFGATLFAARSEATAGTWTTGDEYYYSTDGLTWTASNLGDPYAKKFLVAPNATGTADILWKIKTPNELASNTSGINGGAAWSSPAYIGDTANDITTPYLHNDDMQIGREDGLFWYDADGGIHQLRPDLRTSVSTDNFKYVTSWQGATYHSEINGLGEILGSSFEAMGPTTNIDDIGKRGSCVGLAADKDWLYIAMDEGTNTHIYKCRQRVKDGKLRWSYCPWVYLGTNACQVIEVNQHSTTDRRLWFGYGLKAAYVILSDNPTSDSAAKFDTANTNWLRTSYTYGTNPYWDKMWQSVVTETKGCDATETVTLKYRKNTDTSATSLTSSITTNGVVKTNLSTALTCNRIQFELHLTTTDNALTPEVLMFQARGIEKPETVRIHEATYAIGDEYSKRAKTIKEFLEGGRTNTSLIKFADLRLGQKTTGTASGDYVWVVMEPGYPKIVELSHTKSQQPEYGAQCRFREVSFTIS